MDCISCSEHFRNILNVEDWIYTYLHPVAYSTGAFIPSELGILRQILPAESALPWTSETLQCDQCNHRLASFSSRETLNAHTTAVIPSYGKVQDKQQVHLCSLSATLSNIWTNQMTHYFLEERSSNNNKTTLNENLCREEQRTVVCESRKMTKGLSRS